MHILLGILAFFVIGIPLLYAAGYIFMYIMMIPLWIGNKIILWFAGEDEDIHLW